MLYQKTARLFVEMADTLVAGFDVIDFLQTLSERAVELLDVDASGILLADQRGTLTQVAASSDEARLLELFQLQDEEGPCLDCIRDGQPVICADLTADPQRWPAFSAAALGVGLSSVHAFPLRLRGQVLGAMNLFTSVPHAMSQETIAVAQALADVATIGILNERALRQHQLVTEQLQYALNSRVVVEQAKGMLAEREGISVSDAFVLMRGYARDNNLRLSKVAHAVIAQNPELMDRLLQSKPEAKA